MHKNICLIVDGYSTGKYLAPGLISNGYECWHVQSNPCMSDYMLKSYIGHHFSKSLIYNNNIDDIMTHIFPYQVKAILPGSEPGVILSDLIAEKLGLPGNPSNSSELRRSKFSMYQKLKDKNIPAALFFVGSSSDELLSWKKENGLDKIVLKPLEDAASNDVYFSRSEKEIIYFSQKILSKKNQFNFDNHKFLAQEYLEGQEYIVNTVSVNKKHSVVDVWKKYKTQSQNGFVNLYSVAMDSSDEEYNELIDYTYNVLDALQVYHGPAHTEIILTKNGHRLLETGARLAGAILPSAGNEIFGTNHVKATIDAIINPEEFLLKKHINKRKFGLHFYLKNNRSRMINNVPDFNQIYNLPTFHGLKFLFEQHTVLPPTVSLITASGYGYLIGDSQAGVMDDYIQLREMEEQIYEAMEK